MSAPDLPLTVRWATMADLDFVQQDHPLPPATAARKLAAQELLVAETDRFVGHLRLEYLWSQVPYIALIQVQLPYRRRGTGRALLAFLETYLRGQGHSALYSSSQADEAEPQAWHRHMGFSECGFISGINEGGIGELFFRKLL